MTTFPSLLYIRTLFHNILNRYNKNVRKEVKIMKKVIAFSLALGLVIGVAGFTPTLAHASQPSDLICIPQKGGGWFCNY